MDKCSVCGISVLSAFPLSAVGHSACLQGRFAKDSTVSFHGESVINSKNTYYYGNSLGGIMGEVYMAVTQDVVRGETVSRHRCTYLRTYPFDDEVCMYVCSVSRHIRCCWWALWTATAKKYRLYSVSNALFAVPVAVRVKIAVCARTCASSPLP